jgi:hypothetical protein
MISKGQGTIEDRAKRFNVSKGIIKNIDCGASWKNLREKLEISITKKNIPIVKKKIQLKEKEVQIIKKKVQLKKKEVPIIKKKIQLIKREIPIIDEKTL